MHICTCTCMRSACTPWHIRHSATAKCRVVWRTCSRSNVDVARTSAGEEGRQGDTRRWGRRRRRDRRRAIRLSRLTSRLTLSRLETMARIHVAVRIAVLNLPVSLCSFPRSRRVKLTITSHESGTG